MQCREAERLVDLSLDGEVTPREQAELDVHILECPRCRERSAAHRWMHGSIRAKLQDSYEGLGAPGALKTRVQAELRDAHRQTRAGAWRVALPLAMAVAVVAILSWTRSTAPTLSPDEAVVHHTRNVLPEVRARGSAREVERFIERRLGRAFAVPAPEDRNLRLVGARVSSLGEDEAAHFMYDHRGARVSVFANVKRGAMTVPSSFERRFVHGQPILVGRHRGYNLVATERGNVVYRFVSDLDDAELVRFATSVHR